MLVFIVSACGYDIVTGIARLFMPLPLRQMAVEYSITDNVTFTQRIPYGPIVALQ